MTRDACGCPTPCRVWLRVGDLRGGPGEAEICLGLWREMAGDVEARAERYDGYAAVAERAGNEAIELSWRNEARRLRERGATWAAQSRRKETGR